MNIFLRYEIHVSSFSFIYWIHTAMNRDGFTLYNLCSYKYCIFFIEKIIKCKLVGMIFILTSFWFYRYVHRKNYN